MNTIYKELKYKTQCIIKKGWVPANSNFYNSIGLTLENLLGKEINNFEIPDYEEIEIKTKTENTNEFITLFSATPDNYLFEIKRIYETYGYSSKNNRDFKNFECSLLGNEYHKMINKLLIIKVNRQNQQIELNIYNLYKKLIDNKTSWSFKLLEEKLYRKLRKMLIVKAKRKFIHNKLHFKYINAQYYELKSFNLFLIAIEKGYIRITFKIGYFKSGKRLGQIHDHGTSFDLNSNYIDELYNKIDEF